MKTALDNIFYANLNKKELSSRTVIRTSNDNELVIDVTDLPLEDQQNLLELYTHYQSYRDGMSKTIPSFETWCELQHQQHIQPKWRALNKKCIINW